MSWKNKILFLIIIQCLHVVKLQAQNTEGNNQLKFYISPSVGMDYNFIFTGNNKLYKNGILKDIDKNFKFFVGQEIGHFTMEFGIGLNTLNYERLKDSIRDKITYLMVPVNFKIKLIDRFEYFVGLQFNEIIDFNNQNNPFYAYKLNPFNNFYVKADLGSTLSYKIGFTVYVLKNKKYYITALYSFNHGDDIRTYINPNYYLLYRYSINIGFKIYK
ncbi:MAG: hypothetical protein Kow0079_12140 [Vicingaceae bacterium]